MNFVKNFKQMLIPSVQLVLLGVAIVFAVYNRVNISTFNAFTIFSLIALILVVAGLIYLLIDKKLFASHVVILILYFSNAVNALFSSLFSLRFSPFGLSIPLTGTAIVNFAIFAYLVLMIASYLLNGEIKSEGQKGSINFVVVLMLMYMWLINGFNQALIYLIVFGILYFYGNSKSILLIMSSILIFAIYTNINTMTIVFITSNLITVILAIGMLLLVFKQLLVEFNYK